MKFDFTRKQMKNDEKRQIFQRVGASRTASLIIEELNRHEIWHAMNPEGFGGIMDYRRFRRPQLSLPAFWRKKILLASEILTKSMFFDRSFVDFFSFRARRLGWYAHMHTIYYCVSSRGSFVTRVFGVDVAGNIAAGPNNAPRLRNS